MKTLIPIEECKLEELLPKYTEFLKGEGKAAENTLSAYVSDLKMYIRYLRNNNISEISGINEDTINSYIKLLADKDMSERTISRRISTLKSFLGFLKQNGVPIGDAECKIAGVTVKEKNIAVLSGLKADFIINLPDTGEYRGIRDMAILETICGAGARVGELINLKPCDVDFSEGTLTLRTNDRLRVLPMYERLSNILEIYIKYSLPLFLRKSSSEFLFLNKNGGRFSRQGIWKLLRKYIDKVPDGRDITPNSLRQSLLVHLLENGASRKCIQSFAGYRNLYSLDKYVRMAGNRKKKSADNDEDGMYTAIRNSHPRKTVKCFEIQ